MEMMRIPRFATTLVLGACLFALSGTTAPAPAQDETEDTAAAIATAIETMVTAILEGNDPMRNRMFFELRIIGNESVPALVDLMGDSRTPVREYAMHTVSYIDDPRWIDPVIRLLQEDPEASTRAMACRAVARTQDTPILAEEGRKAIPHLIETLGSDEELVSMDAAFALGWFGDPVARPHLEKAAGSSSELVSFFAKGALEDIDHAEKMAARDRE
jgi:HEAT repeat protein